MKPSLSQSFGILLATALATGCSTLNPKPFVQYQNAVQEAQSGIDAALSLNYNWTRDGFIEGFSSNTNSKFSQIMIQPAEDYAWSMAAAPIYLKVKETRAGLAELNTSFSDYAELLSRLASAELVSTATFDQIASDLNESANSAAKELSVSPATQGFAIFSTAASEAARLYIEKKRQKYLKRAIENNQSNVLEYASLSISLLHTIRGNIKAYYADRVEPLKISWNAASGEKRQKNTESVLNLNEQFADAMHILQELENTYSELPQAHADLAKAIEQPTFNLNGIKKLSASGKRLQKLYKQLESAK